MYTNNSTDLFEMSYILLITLKGNIYYTFSAMFIIKYIHTMIFIIICPGFRRGFAT